MKKDLSLAKIIERELKRAGGGATVTEIPEHRRPTPEGLAKLENEINYAISENNAMYQRTYAKANNMSPAKSYGLRR